MARSSAGTFVTGLTVVALAVVGFLAFQASGAQEKAADASGAGRPVASATPDAAAREKAAREAAEALPPRSGEGRRVVYALADRRVWLVDDAGRVTRTYRVEPGSVSPVPGTYRVTGRDPEITGTDGVPVQHVVRFATFQDTVIGFSAASDDTSRPTIQPGAKTGGIREDRADGAALWEFATLDTAVVVVP
ncbi:hypothetical protein V1J52_07485 [Streptomyces sp. TRM 70351]|uniref:hypothetical protein n=1 Tax=Streptomyces sp. TRM 70351 TaxID=3116552 RepID=UPI002E7B7C05|nr:hypothetical protein [Streptomyces sp. TRM 70351]MEE1928038.1 hypothetical protein [Streptomyces sp. TRM 70351]